TSGGLSLEPPAPSRTDVHGAVEVDRASSSRTPHLHHTVRSLVNVLLVTLSVSFAFDTPAAAAPAVEMFSPQGSIKNVRQVTARFAVPMVALGDPRLPDP